MRRVEGNTIYPFGNVGNSEALKDLWEIEGERKARLKLPKSDGQDNRKPKLMIVPRRRQESESEE